VLLITYFLITHHRTARRSPYTIVTVLPGPTSGNSCCGVGEPGVVKHTCCFKIFGPRAVTPGIRKPRPIAPCGPAEPPPKLLVVCDARPSTPLSSMHTSSDRLAVVIGDQRRVHTSTAERTLLTTHCAHRAFFMPISNSQTIQPPHPLWDHSIRETS
jgi:hypothetical protein